LLAEDRGEATPDYAALLRHYAHGADLMLNRVDLVVATDSHVGANAFQSEALRRDDLEIEAFEKGMSVEDAKSMDKARNKAKNDTFRKVFGTIAVVASIGVIAYGLSSRFKSQGGKAVSSK